MLEKVVTRKKNSRQIGQSEEDNSIAVQQQNLIAAPMKQQQDMHAEDYQSAPVLADQFAAAALQPNSSSK